MKYCGKCGNQIISENLFCTNCGADFKEIQNFTQEIDTNKDKDFIETDFDNSTEIRVSNNLVLLKKSILILLVGSIISCIPFFFVNKTNTQSKIEDAIDLKSKESSVNNDSSINESKKNENITNDNNPAVLSKIDLNDEFVIGKLNEYTNIILSGEFEKLSELFANNVIKFHSVSNISTKEIEKEARNYLKKWTIYAENYEKIEKLSDYQFTYEKFYSITRNKDAKQFNYKIKGYVTFDLNGKIIELVDSKTEKINN